jgi:hypothetical protein
MYSVAARLVCGACPVQQNKEASGSFLKKRTKKLFIPLRRDFAGESRRKVGKVFLLLFLQKKKILSYSGSGNCV